VSHDDSNPTDAENVDGTQNPDDADDAEADGQEDGNEQDGVEDDGHRDGNEQGDVEDDEDKDCRVAGEAVRLSVYLLYPRVFSVSIWTASRALQCLLQHIQALQTLQCARALQLLSVLQSRHFRLLQRLYLMQR